MHFIESSLHNLMTSLVDRELQLISSQQDKDSITIPLFGNLIIPYFKMGKIDSLDLFSLNALILYAFYWKNRHHYKKVLDLGANIGAHTLVLGKLGIEVDAYEPDPVHFAQLERNVKLNKLTNIRCNKLAVSDFSGIGNFTRVLGNTTASHLTGTKRAYGNLDVLDVEVIDIRSIISGFDLVKIDVEGSEPTLLEALQSKDFLNCDFLIEVGSIAARERIFEVTRELKINAFSQKTGWAKSDFLSQLPGSYKEGELFLTMKSEMPW